jgi:hypothetical protein
MFVSSYNKHERERERERERETFNIQRREVLKPKELKQ